MGVSWVGASEFSKLSRCFADVINQYFNPTEEPHKPGTKEKRKKAASFQTVSQLHKVRASQEACSVSHSQSHFPAKTLGYHLAHELLGPEGPPGLLKDHY